MTTLNEGVKITMVGKEWVVPSLSFKQMGELSTVMEKVGNGGLSPENINNMVRIVHAAMSRNYPELSLKEVADMLDMRNALQLFSAVIGQSLVTTKA